MTFSGESGFQTVKQSTVSEVELISTLQLCILQSQAGAFYEKIPTGLRFNKIINLGKSEMIMVVEMLSLCTKGVRFA